MGQNMYTNKNPKAYTEEELKFQNALIEFGSTDLINQFAAIRNGLNRNYPIYTLEGWELSGVAIDKYLPGSCEIDEDLYNYFLGAVSPNFVNEKCGQCGEASFEHDGIMYHETVMYNIDNGKYFFCGVLPDMFNIYK